MTGTEIFGFSMQPWLVIPITYFLWVSVLLMMKRVIFKIIHGFSVKTLTRIDDIIVGSMDFPLTLLIFVSGGLVIERMIPFVNGDLMNYFIIAFKVTAILAVVLFADRLSNSLLKVYSDKVDFLRASGGITRGIVRAIVLGLGLLILLDSFGVSITPVLASLGVGSLAIALALQPTLENFFAGVQIVIDKPIQVGQFVKLESGEEGYVYKIGWRSTWIRMLPNNMVIMPNKNLVNSKITNFYYPEKELAVLVEVGVHYQSDLEKVERVTVEVARQTLREVPGGVSGFDPFIRYHTFDASSINFSVILRAKEFVDGFLLKHEFIKRLQKRYAQEGITIPFPIVAVNYSQENAENKTEI
ncbi:MAG: mechanosensitive ion channel family protein [Candidatus Omnitrophota bacterium]